MVYGRPGRPFYRDLIRRDASITALGTNVPPNAARNPAHGLSSKALPPRRPVKNAYSAQITAAMAVAMTNRRRWKPVSPQVSVTARPAARDEPADDDHLIPLQNSMQVL